MPIVAVGLTRISSRTNNNNNNINNDRNGVFLRGWLYLIKERRR